MEEFNPIDTDKKAPQSKSQAAIRCAKAALLLSSLNVSRNSSPSSPQFDSLKVISTDNSRSSSFSNSIKSSRTSSLELPNHKDWTHEWNILSAPASSPTALLQVTMVVVRESTANPICDVVREPTANPISLVVNEVETLNIQPPILELSLK